MRDLGSDLRFAGRLLARSPALTALLVSLIALGTGANFAIYSAVHAVLLAPLPFDRPESLAALFETSAADPSARQSLSVDDFLDWQKENHSFASLAGYHAWFYNLTGDGEPERLVGGVMTANLPATLGVRPVVGRAFSAAEQGPGGEAVVLIGEGLWKRRFGGSPDVVGRTIRLDDLPFQIVGVLPAAFDLPKGAEIWKPLPHGPGTSPRGFRFLQGVGRLKPGVTAAAAQRDLDAVASRLARQYPESDKDRGALVVPLPEQMLGEVRPAMKLLLAAVGVILALTCVNVSSLLLVRAGRRQGEIALRQALGSSRPRLVRQLVVEGLGLALLGSAAGLLLAVWGSHLLATFGPPKIPRLTAARIGAPVLLPALAVALLAGLAFTVLPALWASRQAPGSVLAASRAGLARGARRLLAWLVAAEIAAALVLLVGSGLMLRSFARLARVDPGFRPAGVLCLRVSLPAARYREAAETNQFASRLEEGLRHLPGVRGVAFALTIPMSPGPRSDQRFQIEGHAEAPGDDRSAAIRPVSAGFFATLGIPVAEGRAFRAEDDARAPKVVVINQEMRRRFFPGEPAMGRHLTLGARLGTMGELDEAPWEIVGVAADVRYAGLGEKPVPEIYFPLAQGTWRALAVVVRTAGDPAALVRPVERTVWALDPNLPLSDVGTLEENLGKSIAQPKFYLALLSAFAGVAWVLALAGVYGTVSLAVRQRTREIGLRMALGAARGRILGETLASGAAVSLAGVLAGLAGAAVASRLLAGLLFEVSPHDRPTYAGAAALVAVAGVLAGLWPAWQATRVDPVGALREGGS